MRLSPDLSTPNTIIRPRAITKLLCYNTFITYSMLFFMNVKEITDLYIKTCATSCNTICLTSIWHKCANVTLGYEISSSVKQQGRSDKRSVENFSSYQRNFGYRVKFSFDDLSNHMRACSHEEIAIVYILRNIKICFVLHYIRP